MELIEYINYKDLNGKIYDFLVYYTESSSLYYYKNTCIDTILDGIDFTSEEGYNYDDENQREDKFGMLKNIKFYPIFTGIKNI